MSSNLTKGLQKQYIFVLALIGFLAVCDAVLFHAAIVGQEKGAEVINIAGRQRMLSQRINMHASRLFFIGYDEEKRRTFEKFKNDWDLFYTSHIYLSDPVFLEQAPVELLSIYRSAPSKVNRDVEILKGLLEEIFTHVEQGEVIGETLVGQISLITERLLPKLDRIVAIHQHDLESKTSKLEIYQWINLVVLLLILVIAGFFVFQRMLDRLQGKINDITEAEERFRSVTNSAVISVIVASGEEGIIEAWNPAAEEAFGYKAEEIIGQPIRVLMPQRYREAHDRGLKYAYETNDYKIVGQTLELEALHKDGHEFPIELSLGRWKLKGKNYFSAIIHDITNRKKSDKEKETLRQQMITAIEAMTEGFALFDADDRLVVYNSVFRDLYRNQLDNIHIGTTMEEMLRSGLKNGVFPQAVGREEAWLAERLRNHLNPQGEVEYQLADGRWLLINERKTKDGGIVGVRTDITEARKAEAELRKLQMAIEQSRSSIIITNNAGKIEYTNPQFTTMTGYGKDEVHGQDFSLFAVQIDLPDQFKNLWGTITSGSDWKGTIENRKKNATSYKVDTVISPVRNRHGKISHFLIIQDDITERLRLEDVLRRQQKLEAVGQLAGGLAHDFNNLLSIIGGNLELLQRSVKDDEKAIAKVDTALKATNRGAKLTKQLLGFTRQQPTNIQTLSINDVIRDVAPLLEHSLSRSVELKFKLAEDIHHVDIDAGDFEDCLVNLAVNARHAIKHSGELLIETENVERNFDPDSTTGEAQSYVQISVTDNGEGIPKDIKEKIFEPFFTTKEKGKGTGLGLAMVFGFVRRSNGFIRVYSEVGVGTSFKIYLPRSLSCRTQLLSPHKQEDSLPKGDEKLLLVDDEAELLELAKTHLVNAGYDVHVTTSPKEAVELLKSKERFDLLFSDVVMPGNMNGFDLAVACLQISPTTKIQLTSGFTAQAGKDLIEGNIFAKQLYQNLLSKPYSQVSLLQAIRKTLDAKDLIAWSADMDIGVQLIDDDHKMLVALLNRLYQACLYQESEGTFRSILNELANYTVFHFKREEAYMASIDYPHLKNHKQVHQLMTSYVMAEIEKVQLNYTRKSGDELLHFIKSWLVDHIMGMDKDVSAYARRENKPLQ